MSAVIAQMTSAGVPSTALVVVGVAVGALLIGVALIGEFSRAYDEIGNGVFDRAGGKDGHREPPDAEYEEFGAALASICIDRRAANKGNGASRPTRSPTQEPLPPSPRDEARG